jgi:hypothetical protein
LHNTRIKRGVTEGEIQKKLAHATTKTITNKSEHENNHKKITHKRSISSNKNVSISCLKEAQKNRKIGARTSLQKKEIVHQHHYYY